MGVGAKKKPGWSRNSMLNDDVLSQILTKVIEKEDRKAFSEVCKQWLSVERLTRTSLRLSQPMSPLVLLTRFPNLVDFRSVEQTKKKAKQKIVVLSRLRQPARRDGQIVSQARDIRGDN